MRAPCEHERASFCPLLDQGRENESLPESRQTLDGYRSRKSGLGNLVCSRQTGSVSSANIRYMTPLYHVHGYQAWLRKIILATCTHLFSE